MKTLKIKNNDLKPVWQSFEDQVCPINYDVYIQSQSNHQVWCKVKNQVWDVVWDQIWNQVQTHIRSNLHIKRVIDKF